MRDLARALSWLLLLVLPGLARGERRPGLDEALRLEAELKKAIERAAPSVACILVSRSDAYRRWESAPAADDPGKLGRFDAAAALSKVPEGDTRARRSIRDHDLSDPAVVPESFGTGLVLAKSGLILTNAHVVRHATKVYVRFAGGRGSWADIHAADPRSDLAVLRLLDRVPGLEPVTFGDGEKVARGQLV